MGSWIFNFGKNHLKWTNGYCKIIVSDIRSLIHFDFTIHYASRKVYHNMAHLFRSSDVPLLNYELMTIKDISDVTLVTEEKKQIKANTNILSACSPVFK